MKQRSGLGMYIETGTLHVKVFWNGWCLESYYEGVIVSFAARVVFDCDVGYV